MCLRSWLWVYQVTFHNKIKKAWKSNLHNLPLTRYLTSIHRILKIWKPEKSFDSSESLNSILPTLQTQLILSIKTLQISSIPKPLIKPLKLQKNHLLPKNQKSIKNFQISKNSNFVCLAYSGLSFWKTVLILHFWWPRATIEHIIRFRGLATLLIFPQRFRRSY